MRVRTVALKRNKKNIGYKRGTGIYNSISLANGKGKLCIVRSLGGIGDVLMCTPTIMQLRKDFPKLEIYFAIDMSSTDSYKLLLNNFSAVDYLISAKDVGRYSFDWKIDITSVCIRHEHSSEKKKNRIDIFANALGIRKLDNPLPFYSVTREESKQVESYIRENKKNVFIHTASFDPQRSPSLSIFHDLIKAHPDVNFLVSDFNNKNRNWNYSNCQDISSLPIRAKAALIKLSDRFIGPDSGLMHIAGAVGTQSVVIFGSIPAKVRINYYPTHRAYTKDLDCLGCWYKPCPYNRQCMKELDVEKISRMLRL